MRSPKNPIKTEEGISNISNVHSGTHLSETTKAKRSNALKGKPLTEKHKQKIAIATKKRFEDPKERKKTSESIRKGWKNPDTRKNHINSQIGRIQSEETRKKIGLANKGKIRSEKTHNKLKESNSGEKNGMFGKKHSKDSRQRNSASQKKRFQNPENRKKLSRIQKQRHLDRAWYGNVCYPDRRVYCELWNKSLRERIRAYWNHKSVLSGKTKKENNNQLLSCHHVYYQEKACCIWDGDTQGYYANINIGTRKNPIIIKYYIKGDPNKFVTLSSQEHGWTKKDKPKWIKIFEDIIENQGGKCYLTKDEWNEKTRKTEEKNV